MKTVLSSRRLFVIGFVILAATNIVVLSRVASNRFGEPELQITLTERELHLPYRVHNENSGLALSLAWRALSKERDNYAYPDWRSPAWLNADKVEELGFNPGNYPGSNGKVKSDKHPIPKEVYIVLENDGAAYREAVKRAEAALEKEKGSLKLNPKDKKLRDNVERAEERLRRERITETRLFAIDAGLDPHRLREKYDNRKHFIITKALIKPRYDGKKKEVSGYISKLSSSRIHVALKYRKIFDTILVKNKTRKNKIASPRYKVKLAYGSHFVPWIVSVTDKNT
jgi:hypothetical protein